MDTDDKDVRRKFVQFWEVFFQNSAQFRGALVSAHCFFDKVWQVLRCPQH